LKTKSPNVLNIWQSSEHRAYKNENEISEEEAARTHALVNKFSVCSNLLWGIWALVQARFSDIDFDYLGFHRQRMNAYFERRDEFFEM
jgi:ethanolamine kinase